MNVIKFLYKTYWLSIEFQALLRSICSKMGAYSQKLILFFLMFRSLTLNGQRIKDSTLNSFYNKTLEESIFFEAIHEDMSNYGEILMEGRYKTLKLN
ncbi:MAG: hypothetical protein AAF696_19535, partial [Bacteroidota bacterium]